jgi:glycosyltransferase involved in cell wall biosynthesis
MRLLRHAKLHGWSPVLLVSSEGWLTSECAEAGIPVICEPFPSSRSLLARARGNRKFAKRVVDRLREMSIVPSVVHGNDHLEGILDLEIAKRLGARTGIFLRSSGMSRRDYFKYRCNEHDFVAAVCGLLYKRASGWEGSDKLRQIFDGIEENDFAPPKPKVDHPPNRILIVGSPAPGKGWADLTEALYLLDKEGARGRLQIDFTGAEPNAASNDLKLERLAGVEANFLGRVEKFHELLRQYDLVIVPSRMECFGTAAIETLAAGVPLLATQTGAVTTVLDNPELLVPPERPDLLAKALGNIVTRWCEIDFGVPAAQEKIRRLYLVDQAAEQLGSTYLELTKR